MRRMCSTLAQTLLIGVLAIGFALFPTARASADAISDRYEQYRYALETLNLPYEQYVARQNDFFTVNKCNGKDICKKPAPYSSFDWSDDGCSGQEQIGPLSNFYRNLFNKPCRQHDFGYRNFGKGLNLYRNEIMRRQIDDRLKAEMISLCNNTFPGWKKYVNWAACQNEASVVYLAVRKLSNWGSAGTPPPKPSTNSPTPPPSSPSQPPPLPPVSAPSVTLAQGPVAPSGFRYAVALAGFTAGTNVTITCYDSVSPGGFYSFNLTIDGSGNATTSSHCYSGDGPDHWVVAGGIQSNHVTWGGGGGVTPPPAATWAETVGGNTNTWTNYSNAGGTAGPIIASNTTVAVSCRISGFRVANGNIWWYRISSPPWSNNFYASADAFYNNGATSGSLSGTPFVDLSVASC